MDLPEPFEAHAMAYDSHNKRVWAVGGNDLVMYLERESSSAWMAGPPLPAGRRRHAMAYDEERRQLVVFGGEVGAAVVDTTLVLDVATPGSSWITKFPVTRPPARVLAAMAYDSSQRFVVLHGGNDPSLAGNPFYRDTWYWNGDSWAQGASGPLERTSHAMAYDSRRGQVYVFGGRSNGAFLGDLWALNHNAWSQVTAVGPGARDAFGMVYDYARERLVVTSGGDPAGRKLDDVWEFDGTSWLRRANTGRGRVEFAIAYDGDFHDSIMTGGHDASGTSHKDTWRYAAENPAKTEVVGPGCPGQTVGTPNIRVGDGVFPWIDKPLDVELQNIGTVFNAAALLVGSKLYVGSGGVGFDMGFFQMPSCVLYPDFFSPQEAVVTLPVRHASSSATVTIDLTKVPNLAGKEWTLQAIVADQGSNGLGLVLSNGLKVSFGSR